MTGTGGVADESEFLLQKFGKRATESRVFTNQDPEQLVAECLAAEVVHAPFVGAAVGVNDFGGEVWEQCPPVTITRLWSGAPAAVERYAEARVCWSNEALHVRFVGSQHEPLIVSAEPITDRETLGLWDRDVCEIFWRRNAEIPGATLNSRRPRQANGSIWEFCYGRRQAYGLGLLIRFYCRRQALRNTS